MTIQILKKYVFQSFTCCLTSELDFFGAEKIKKE